MSLCEWKRLIREQVKGLDCRYCILKTYMYETLGLLNSKYEFPYSQWWVHSSHDPSVTRKCCYVVRQLLQVRRLIVKRCILCSNLFSVCHILFECNCLNDDRQLLWNKIRFPVGLRRSIEAMSNQDKTGFILNAFGI